MEVAPASGVPTDFSASGRARPTLGRSSAVASACSCAVTAALVQASCRGSSVSYTHLTLPTKA